MIDIKLFTNTLNFENSSRMISNYSSIISYIFSNHHMHWTSHSQIPLVKKRGNFLALIWIFTCINFGFWIVPMLNKWRTVWMLLLDSLLDVNHWSYLMSKDWWFSTVFHHCPFYIQASICSAGDSASYHRTSVFGDDVVIVA